MLRWAILLVAGLVVIAAILLIPQARRDLAAARDRLAAEGPKIAETPCGSIEYAERGTGPAVLIAHGIFGGFDQGLGMAKGYLGPDVRVIAPSRFGYLATPLPMRATLEMQADAHACLLDHLGVDHAVLFGTSAGATSALQFALRHPDRTAGLILMTANAPGEVEVKPMPRPLAEVLFRSDALFWLLTTHLQSALAPMMGVPDGYALTPDQEAAVAEIMRSILPVKPRADGALFDMYVSNPHINSGYALESLAMPALVINARDDPMTLYANAEALAARLPNAELLALGDGGHLLLGHEDEVRGAIARFLTTVGRD